MSSIQFVNQAEVLAGIRRKLEDIQKAHVTAAKQMGIVAKQVIQAEVPPHVVTSHWQKSINYHVEKISDLVTELTVGSNGAERYYSIQENLNHPIEIGWNRVQPEMTNIYQRVISEGLGGRSVTQTIASSGIDEFSMMGGM